MQPLGPEIPSHAAPWPGNPTLKGSYVTLCALSNSHTDDLFKVLSGEANAYLYDYLPYDEPSFDLENFSASINDKINDKEMIFFAIIDSKTNTAVGYIGLEHIDPKHRRLEVGNILFSTGMQRSTASTEAVYLILRYTFDDLGYRRVEWKTNSLHAKSRQAAKRRGFSFEGVFLSHMIVNGRNRDTAYFAMLDSEWPMNKHYFEKWLADDNFDKAGKQISSLEALRKELAGAKVND